jgi:plasmid stabilization system protein ParE
MRVVFHPGVSDDLDSILGWLKVERPEAVEPFWRDIGEAVGRISVWPETAPAASKPKNTRVLTLVRYPYRIFYRLRPGVVEILHIRHTSRAPWAGGR